MCDPIDKTLTSVIKKENGRKFATNQECALEISDLVGNFWMNFSQQDQMEHPEPRVRVQHVLPLLTRNQRLLNLHDSRSFEDFLSEYKKLKNFKTSPEFVQKFYDNMMDIYKKYFKHIGQETYPDERSSFNKPDSLKTGPLFVQNSISVRN
ncbi:hypothetical protein [Holospora obtusa]|uniref:hypothetical protein n=1 Tax=Holospora obtusa TaxID=49893 RepID=UPI00138AD251|nr:hypothetical protein [Holospora obtusa]